MSGATMMAILHVAFAFGLVIFVHELGHFLLCKKNGVRVEKFSIGFGKKLIGFKRGGTEYCLSVIPLGGYVKPAGEEPREGEAPKEGELFSKGPGARAQIFVAGVAMNFLLAIFLISLVSFIGVKIPNYSNQIGNIEKDSPGESWGLGAGDKIIALNETQINDWYSLGEAIGALDSKQDFQITVMRQEQELILTAYATGEDWGLSPYIPAEIGSVILGLPAYEAGVKEGDRILSVDGEPIGQWYELAEKIRKSTGRELFLEIERNQTIFKVKVTPQVEEVRGESYRFIGIEAPSFGQRKLRFGVFRSLGRGVEISFYEALMTYRGLWMLISHPRKYGKYMGGPVLITQMMAQELKKGYVPFLFLVARVNIWLMVMNLLPIPILDGGHLLFTLIESIRRKPLSLKIQQALQQAGLFFLIALMVFALTNDVFRKINREKALRQEKIELRKNE